MLLQLFRFDNKSLLTEYVGHNQYGSKKSAISTRTDVSAKLGSENKIEGKSTFFCILSHKFEESRGGV